jgi:16S rRNA (guanine966-N2)-methyltransferase
MMAAVRTPTIEKPRKGEAPRKVRNSVRIIAGGWRGRRIHFPDLPGLRPTSDRVRETLFNWLQSVVAGSRCLDLFAGSGALGIEALSRGAGEVVFVELAAVAARSLSAELLRLGAGPKARVVEFGASRFLRGSQEAAPVPFDLVFLDPPFGQGAMAEYIPLIDAGHWVRPGGLVYLECERSLGAPLVPDHWQLLKSKTAGEVGYHLARVQARSDRNSPNP